MSQRALTLVALACVGGAFACGARHPVVRTGPRDDASASGRSARPAVIRALSSEREPLSPTWGTVPFDGVQAEEARDLSRAARWGDVVWLRGGGRVVVWDPVVTVFTAGGRMRQGRGPGGCDLTAAWGDDAFLRCAWGGFRVTAEGRMVHVEPPRGEPNFYPPRDVVFSDDGDHAAFLGECRLDRTTSEAEVDDEASREVDGDASPEDNVPEARDSAGGGAPPAPPGAVCVFDDRAHAWRAVVVRTAPEPSGASDPLVLLAMQGTTLLLRWGDERYATFDVATGAAAQFLAPTGRGAAWRVQHLGLAADGTFVALARRCEPSRCDALRLLAGRSPGALAERPAPEGAERVAFADAARGVAWETLVSGELGHVWRTLDAGATWELVPLPPGAAPTPRWSRTNTACGADGCSLGDSIRLEGWGPLPPAAPDPEE